MKINAAPSKPHAQQHHAHAKHDTGFEELLKENPSPTGESAPKGRVRGERPHPESKLPATLVPPHPASGHTLAKEKGQPHVVLAPLPKLGSHVALEPKHEKDKLKPAGEPPPHAQPPSQVEQQLLKAEVQAPAPQPNAPAQPTVSLAAPVPVAVAPELKAAPPPLPPLPIEPALAQQDSLRVLLLPHAAKVSVETAEAGRLSMRVDVRDGVAHVRATGEAAGLVDARTAELRVALAQEGLALGNFELGQQHRRPDEPERPSDASGFRRAQPAAKPATEGEKPLDGGLHIHA